MYNFLPLINFIILFDFGIVRVNINGLIPCYPSLNIQMSLTFRWRLIALERVLVAWYNDTRKIQKQKAPDDYWRYYRSSHDDSYCLGLLCWVDSTAQKLSCYPFLSSTVVVELGIKLTALHTYTKSNHKAHTSEHIHYRRKDNVASTAESSCVR